jgi:hypothetical protein
VTASNGSPSRLAANAADAPITTNTTTTATKELATGRLPARCCSLDTRASLPEVTHPRYAALVGRADGLANRQAGAYEAAGHHANARRSWNRILRTAGVEHRDIHHLRHAYVTMLAEQGVHERVAQQLAGHADARMTREIYTHVTAPMFDAAADAISQAVDGTFGSSADANGSSDPEVGSRNGSKATNSPDTGDDLPYATDR